MITGKSNAIMNNSSKLLTFLNEIPFVKGWINDNINKALKYISPVLEYISNKLGVNIETMIN